MNELEVKEKAHYISVTGIVVKDEKFLICRRSEKEKIFPGKWCVPGGKIQQSDFINTAKDTNDHWFDIFEKVLKKEIKEETNLEIKSIGYVSNLALIRPNGFTTIIVSLYAEHASGEVVLQDDELVDYAWISLEEAKNYDLIENIYEQLEKVQEILSRPDL
ncbi:MAG: NUDIX domain-containing protein [Candidatus Nanoarchaeia archaeon]